MTDRPATTDPVDPLCRAGQCGHERHALPDPLQPPRPMTDEEAAEFERRWSATVPPRASEAPGDAHSPTPDVGAVRGGEGGSAGESEPRGIVGPGYDAVWTYIRTHPGGAYRNAAIWRAVEAFRDAVIPAIRARVADEIADLEGALTDAGVQLITQRQRAETAERALAAEVRRCFELNHEGRIKHLTKRAEAAERRVANLQATLTEVTSNNDRMRAELDVFRSYHQQIGDQP